jgi:hypothetical protein
MCGRLGRSDIDLDGIFFVLCALAAVLYVILPLFCWRTWGVPSLLLFAALSHLLFGLWISGEGAPGLKRGHRGQCWVGFWTQRTGSG